MKELLTVLGQPEVFIPVLMLGTFFLLTLAMLFSVIANHYYNRGWWDCRRRLAPCLCEGSPEEQPGEEVD